MTENGYYQNNNHYFYIKNHLGSNVVVAGKNGNIVQNNHYYPFGLTMGFSDNHGIQPYKFGSKELDRTNGLDFYDFEARSYDPVLMRFMRPDPLGEKYYSISPYAYCGNNPVNAVDLKGDSVTFTAENRDLIKQTTTLINEGVGSNVAKVDKNGVLSVKNLSDKQLSKLTPEQQAFYSSMKDAATSSGMATIGIVSGSEDVFVGSYELGQIDIADVNAFETGEGGNKFSSFGHEVVEQQKKQIEGKSYNSAHTIYALSAEDKISGYTRGRSDQTGVSHTSGKMNGTLIVPFTNAQKRVLLHINITNNNITSIQRK